MKKNRLCFALCLLIAATAMMLNSCSKDEADEDLLIGNWKISGVEYYWSTKCAGSAIEEDSELLNERQVDAEFGASNFKFNKDNTWTSTERGRSESGTWKLSGNTLTLTIKNDNQIFKIEIKELTSSKMVFSNTDTYIDEEGCTNVERETTTFRKV